MNHIAYPALATFIVATLLFYVTAFAASSGPNSPDTAIEDTAVGDTAWTDYGNVLASDNAYAVLGGAAGGAFDTVRLVKGGTISGDDKGTGQTITASDVYYSFGGAADLWGVALTADDINATTFGVAVSMTNGGDTGYYIKATDFDFAIPAGATINGVTAEVEAKDAACEGTCASVDHIRVTVTYTEGATKPTNISHQTGTIQVLNGTIKVL